MSESSRPPELDLARDAWRSDALSDRQVAEVAARVGAKVSAGGGGLAALAKWLWLPGTGAAVAVVAALSGGGRLEPSGAGVDVPSRAGAPAPMEPAMVPFASARGEREQESVASAARPEPALVPARPASRAEPDATWSRVASALGRGDREAARGELDRLASDAEPATRGKALLGAAQLELGRGNPDEAARLAQRVLDMSDASAQQKQRARALLARARR